MIGAFRNSSHWMKMVSQGEETKRVSQVAFSLISENAELHLLFFRRNAAEMKRCKTMLRHFFNENRVIFIW